MTPPDDSEPRWVPPVVYTGLGAVALVVCSWFVFGTYIVGDSSFVLWRDAKAELWTSGAFASVARERAATAFAALASAAACFVAALRRRITGWDLVTVFALAADLLVVGFWMSPPSPYG